MPKCIIKRVLIGFVALSALVDATFFLMKAMSESPFSLAKHRAPEIPAAAGTEYNLDKSLVE